MITITAPGAGLSAVIPAIASRSAGIGGKIQIDSSVIRSLGSDDSAALIQIDSDGAGTNAKMQLYLQSDTLGNARVVLNMPGAGGINTPYVGITSYPVSGSFAEIYFAIDEVAFHQYISVFDQNGNYIISASIYATASVNQNLGQLLVTQSNGRVTINSSINAATKTCTYGGLEFVTGTLSGTIQWQAPFAGDAALAWWKLNDVGSPATASASVGGQGLALTSGHFTYLVGGNGAWFGGSAASITVTPSASYLYSASVLQITGTVFDGQGDVLSTPVSWSSNASAIASVNGTGLISWASPGSASITAFVSGTGISSSVAITAQAASTASTVNVSPINALIPAGSTLQESATVLDQFGFVMNGVVLLWNSSIPTNAIVNNTGLVTWVAPGTASISASVSASNPNIFGTSFITLGSPPYNWFSSNTAIETVNTIGLVTGISHSVGFITASRTDNGLTGYAQITII